MCAANEPYSLYLRAKKTYNIAPLIAEETQWWKFMIEHAGEAFTNDDVYDSYLRQFNRDRSVSSKEANNELTDCLVLQFPNKLSGDDKNYRSYTCTQQWWMPLSTSLDKRWIFDLSQRMHISPRPSQHGR